MGDNMLSKETFFSKLNRSYAYIKANVDELTEFADNEFNKYSNEINGADVEKVRDLDLDVKRTYSQISILQQMVRENVIDLSMVKNKFDKFEEELNRFVGRSGLEKYGYKPLERPGLLTTDQEVGGECPMDISLEKKEDSIESKNHSIRSKNRTFSTSTFKVSSPKNTPNSSGFSKWEQMKMEKKMEASKTPQLHDFGISRKSTYWAKIQTHSDSNLINRSDNEKEFEKATVPIKMPYFDAEEATRKFSMFTNYSTKLYSTPQKSELTNQSELSTGEVTVEITPGLTTKVAKKQIGRIAASKRVEPNTSDIIRARNHLTFKQSKRITPEAPSNSMDSAAFLKSLKKDRSNDGTPKMPSPAIDLCLQQRLLNMKMMNK